MRTILIIAFIFSAITSLTLCTNKKADDSDSTPWLNQNDTVQYVGKETCRLCHADKFETFMHTGMGMSFDHATHQKSSAIFDEHALVYDKANDFYYKPYWQHDSLKIMEFRIKDGDTIHKRIETVDYIIGSGQHTNSHLIQLNGYIYQAPITFYTQKKEWDLAPGMESGFSSRFSRVIQFECMNCHNGLPTVVEGSVNKYQKVLTGIDCERCHGPGSLHVARISQKITVDTSKEIDYSIVNPANLSIDLQNQLCMRCHLQGVNVLNDRATYFDFKPGDKISDHWNIFLPTFDGKNDKFLMASQADRLMQSRCFKESNKLSCITCHNPHVSVKETPVEQFNSACLNCHSEPNQTCTETVEVRKLSNDNCSGCHIIKSGSVDIPHVSISDHKIQIPGKETAAGDGKFTGLKCLTSENPSSATMAEGYLIYYEAFNKDPELLNDALAWLSKETKPDAYHHKIEIHYFTLSGNLDGVITSAKKINDEELDAWTAYRIADAFFQKKDFSSSEKYFDIAINIQPYNLDYRYKRGVFRIESNNIDGAKEDLNFVLKENPHYDQAWVSLAFIQSYSGDFDGAEKSLLKAIDLNPDNRLARLNIANVYINTRQKSKAKTAVDYLDEHWPEDAEVQALKARLKSI